MGKRSDFKRIERNFYPTPETAVIPLLKHLPEIINYCEPCAGNGALVDALSNLRGYHECSLACDVFPQADFIYSADAKSVSANILDDLGVDTIITNPPWPEPGKGGDPMLSIALHLISLRRTVWLLLSSDTAHNVYFSKHLAKYCSRIVSVGRVSWAGNGVAGKDNASWYCFEKDNQDQTRFYGRAV